MQNSNLVKVIENNLTINDVMSGPLALLFEPWLYHFASRSAQNYDGGSWSMTKLSNGGFFYLLDTDKTIEVMHPHGWSGEISSFLFSVCASMATCSNLSGEYYMQQTKGKVYPTLSDSAKAKYNEDGESISENYHLLRDFLYQDGSIFTSEEMNAAYSFLD